MNLMFDIGFNVGDFSKKFIDNYPGIKIVGVEPNSYLPRLNHPNVTILNKLASSTSNEMIDFCIARNHVLSTANEEWKHTRFKNEQWYPPIKIESISIDDLIKLHGIPDLIKIDVEGYEFNVISGLKFKAQEIMFEWTEELFFSSTLPCVEYLRKLGYEQFGYTSAETERGAYEKCIYDLWENLDIQNTLKITPSRQYQWGMIYCK